MRDGNYTAPAAPNPGDERVASPIHYVITAFAAAIDRWGAGEISISIDDYNYLSSAKVATYRSADKKTLTFRLVRQETFDEAEPVPEPQVGQAYPYPGVFPQRES